TGSFIFGADTVTLGPLGFNNMRATIALTSPTSGHFSASMLSQSGVQTDLTGNITRSKDTTIVRLDSAAVLVDADNRYRLESPSRAQFSKGFLTLDSLILPHMFGQISLADGTAGFSNLGTRFNHIRADISLAGDSVHIKQLSAETNKDRRGSANVTGSVSFEHYDNPSFSLTANASNFHAIDKGGLAALDISTGPPVTLTGSTQDAVMRGTVRVERGSIYIPEVMKKKVIDLNDPE